MNYRLATDSQLLTIAYHEHCTPVERVKALQELRRRNKQTHGKLNARIKRKLS